MAEEVTQNQTTEVENQGTQATEVAETVDSTKSGDVEEKSLLSQTEEGQEEGQEEGNEEGEKEQTSELPEKYEVNLPEGMELDEGLVENLTPILKELNINQEGFQKLIDVYAPHIQQQSEQMVEKQRQESLSSFKETVNEWRNETQKELGSDAKKELAYAARFIDKMAGSKENADALRELLDETGVGNHVALNRLFINAGKKISEDSFAQSESLKTTSKGLDPRKLYPTMQQ